MIDWSLEIVSNIKLSDLKEQEKIIIYTYSSKFILKLNQYHHNNVRSHNSRTVEKERLHRLQDLLSKFAEGHAKIKNIPNTPKDYDYFVTELFSDISSLIKTYTLRLEEEMNSVDKKVCSAQQLSGITEEEASNEALEEDRTKLVAAIQRQGTIISSLRGVIEGLSMDNYKPCQYFEIKNRTIEKLWQQLEHMGDI